jgi:hypothetical protein
MKRPRRDPQRRIPLDGQRGIAAALCSLVDDRSADYGIDAKDDNSGLLSHGAEAVTSREGDPDAVGHDLPAVGMDSDLLTESRTRVMSQDPLPSVPDPPVILQLSATAGPIGLWATGRLNVAVSVEGDRSHRRALRRAATVGLVRRASQRQDRVWLPTRGLASRALSGLCTARPMPRQASQLKGSSGNARR